VILHLTYGLQVLNTTQQSPTTTIATESLHADHTRGELHQLAGLHSARWISLCALVFFDSVATCFYSVYDWHWRCCAFGVTSCGFIDSTLALLLKIHLRFRGSFLRFHIMALVNTSKRLTQVGIVHKRNTNLQVLLLFFYSHNTTHWSFWWRECLSEPHTGLNGREKKLQTVYLILYKSKL